MPPSRSRCDSRASEQGPYESVVASEPRRTVKQAHPLPKGAACIPCSTRRVRCSGERPACAACVRHARWNGNNPKKNHGCCYKPSKAEAEQAEEEEDEQQELRSAKDKITELEDKISQLEDRLHERRHTHSAGSFAPFPGSVSPPTQPSLPFDKTFNITLPPPALTTLPTPSPTFTSPDLDFVHPSFLSSSASSSPPPLPPTSLAPSAFYDPTPQEQSFTLPFFAFTPPPSNDVSPIPSYYDIPTTLSELLSVSIPIIESEKNSEFATFMTLAGVTATLSSQVKSEQGLKEEEIWDGLYKGKL